MFLLFLQICIYSLFGKHCAVTEVFRCSVQIAACRIQQSFSTVLVLECDCAVADFASLFQCSERIQLCEIKLML